MLLQSQTDPWAHSLLEVHRKLELQVVICWALEEFGDTNYFHIMTTVQFSLLYRNDPKFLDRWFWANSADPDQTAPRGAV